MTRKITCILAALVLLVMGMVAVANAFSSFEVYTIDDFAFYNEQYSGTSPIIENFENDKINTPGLTITSVGVDNSLYTLGYYQNIVDDATGSYQVVSYTTPMNGWGGWFDLSNPGGPGSSINVYVGTDPTTGILVGNIPNTQIGEFWSFFADTPFTSVVLADGGLPGQETYQIVDMAICPVPIPPAAILLGSGLLGLVGLRFRRKLS
jgi:hypothetical protein